MGFFIRRAVRLGPIRFNFSKSGVGVSAGVKGLRVGQDARGKPYIFGRVLPGLYWRERLGKRGSPALGCFLALAVLGLLVAALMLLGSLH